MTSTKLFIVIVGGILGVAAVIIGVTAAYHEGRQDGRNQGRNEVLAITRDYQRSAGKLMRVQRKVIRQLENNLRVVTASPLTALAVREGATLMLCTTGKNGRFTCRGAAP